MSILTAILSIFNPGNAGDMMIRLPKWESSKCKSTGVQAIDIPRLIRSLKAVENWDGHSVGAKGERGALQMRKATWKQFTDEPHELAESRSFTALAVEQEYAEWLVAVAPTDCALNPPTVYDCALLHTAGYGNVMKGRVGKAKREFAERVVNCYEEDAK